MIKTFYLESVVTPKPWRWLYVFAALVGCTAIFACVSWGAWITMVERGRAEKWESHTRVVLLQATRALSALQDAETGQRGYLLTANDTFLEPYNNAIAHEQQTIDNLAALTRDNPTQQPRVAALRKVATAKLAFISQTLALAKAGHRTEAIAVIGNRQGKQLMDNARTIIKSIEAEEARLLVIRQAKMNAETRLNAAQATAVNLVGILALIAAFLSAWLAQTTMERLMASEQRLRLFVDRAPVAIAMFDTNMRYLAVSRRFINVFSLEPESPESLIGRTPADLFPNLPIHFREVHDRVFAGETISHGEDRFVQEDGSVTWLNWEMAPWRRADGSVAGALLFSEDITRRKVEQTALAQSEARLRGLLNTVSEGIILATESGRIISCNPATVRMFGYDNEPDMVGRALKVLMSPDEAARHDAYLLHHVTTDQSRELGVPGRALSGIRKDGSEFPIELSVGSFYSGSTRYLTAVLRDLTERVKSEQIERYAEELEVLVKLRTYELEKTQGKLIQASKIEALGSLTAGVAHDFNNLLGVILLNLDVARTLLPVTDRARNLVVEALASARHGAELIRNLLAFARRQPLKPAAVELNELVLAMSDLLARTLGEHIGITCELANDLWPVIADAAQVESSLLNLATNARDAMPQGGHLIITTGNQPLDEEYAMLNPSVVAGDYVMISVSDNGVGMPPDVVAKIFEPFFTTKEEGKGTGLGLSMVFGFAGQSGGHVSVYSVPGVGTTFRLFLPRAQEGAEKVALLPVDPSAVPTGNGELILVVEDNPAMRNAVVRQLATLNYRTIEADSAAAALMHLEESEVDLIFSDIVMPGGIEGLELADRVRARWPNVRVLLTSGFIGDRAGRHKYRAEMPLNLLGKPYDLHQLAIAVSEALNCAVLELEA